MGALGAWATTRFAYGEVPALDMMMPAVTGLWCADMVRVHAKPKERQRDAAVREVDTPGGESWCPGCDKLVPLKSMGFVENWAIRGLVDDDGDGKPDPIYLCRTCRGDNSAGWHGLVVEDKNKFALNYPPPHVPSCPHGSPPCDFCERGETPVHPHFMGQPSGDYHIYQDYGNNRGDDVAGMMINVDAIDYAVINMRNSAAYEQRIARMRDKKIRKAKLNEQEQRPWT